MLTGSEVAIFGGIVGGVIAASRIVEQQLVKRHGNGKLPDYMHQTVMKELGEIKGGINLIVDELRRGKCPHEH